MDLFDEVLVIRAIESEGLDRQHSSHLLQTCMRKKLYGCQSPTSSGAAATPFIDPNLAM
jgi:hypothetical protein